MKLQATIALNLIAFIIGIGISRLVLSPSPPETGKPHESESNLPVEKNVENEPTPEKKTLHSSPDFNELIGMHSFPVQEDGEGAISGTVRTPKGEAVAGAVACLVALSVESSEKERTSETEESHDLAIRLYRFIENELRYDASRQEVVTDAAGRFEATGLSWEKYDVAVRKKGFEIESTYAKAGDHIEFIARPLVSIPVEVVLSNGMQPEKAEIEFSLHSGDSYPHIQIEWLREYPHIQLPLGTFSIDAQTFFDGELYTCSSRHFVHSPAEQTGPLTLYLTPDFTIKGNVIFPKNEPVNDVDVYCVHLVIDTIPPDLVSLYDLKQVADRKSTDYCSVRDPQFQFDSLEPGIYLLCTGRTKAKVEVFEKVVISDASVEQNLVLPPRPLTDYVRIHVCDPSGRPLLNVDVKAKWKSAEHSFHNYDATLARDNAYWLLLEEMPAERAPESGPEYTIAAESPLYGIKKTVWSPDDPRDIILRYDDPAILDVNLIDYSESTYKGKLSLIIVQEEKEYTFSPYEMSKNGTITAGPLLPGSCLITLSLEHQEIEKLDVDLVPGKNIVDLAIPDLHELTAAYPDAHQRYRAILRSFDNTTFFKYIFVEKGEKAHFRNVPAGSYKLSMFCGLRTQEMDITVPHPGDVTYAPEKLNAFEVDEFWSPYFREIGLKEGDYIVGVDGRRFSDVLDFLKLIWAARTRNTATILILRQDKEMTIPVDLRRFAKEASYHYGSALYPVRL